MSAAPPRPSPFATDLSCASLDFVIICRRPEGRVQYGRSCRDVSLRLPQDLVALHAAVASRQFTGLNDADSAGIRIWTTDETPLEVSTVSVAVSQVTRAALGEWTVLYDDQLDHSTSSHRAAAERDGWDPLAWLS